MSSSTALGTVAFDRDAGAADLAPPEVEPFEDELSPEALVERLDRHRRRFASLLLSSEPSGWLTQLQEEIGSFRQMVFWCPDETLYYLVHTSTHESSMYSATHAMICAAISDLVAQWCKWPHREITALANAAITMNLGMTSLQDLLAERAGCVLSEERGIISEHAKAGKNLLCAAGVSDSLWLETVEHHHQHRKVVHLHDMPAVHRLSEVLHRVDVYTAKLSRRRQRHATSSALAAKHSFLSGGRVPDEIGAALLRVVGLYPPGSWVLLANGDIGLVIRRGLKAHLPFVAAVRRKDGGLYQSPECRDTSIPGFTILRGLRVGDARILVQHHKLLGCYEQPSVF